jgi:hypothetical protein
MIADLNATSSQEGLCSYCLSALPRGTTICGNNAFCSTLCQEQAFSNYPRHISRVDLSFLESSTSSTNTGINQSMLLPRLLSILLTSDNKSQHPLSHPVLARWKADFRSPEPLCFPFSFSDNIKKPIQILHALGIDVFAEEQFDTWVIQNLLNRITTNALLRHPLPSDGCLQTYSPQCRQVAPSNCPARTYQSSINQTVEVINLGYLLPLFNHSCSPNLRVYEGPGGVWVRASRDIREGEELSVSYVNESLLESDRRRRLMAWFNECLCSECEKERSG